MKTSRRDFLKAASMAFASLFAPKVKVELDNQGVNGIVSKPTATIYDLLSDFNETVQVEADKPKRDQADSLEIKNALDACDCQFDVQVHYEQCKEPEVHTCENCSTYYFCPRWEKGHTCDTWGYDARIKPGAQIYVTYDKGETWELVGEADEIS